VVFGPWKDHFEGMAHKTCVRQLAKWMPKSTELATAIAADNTVRLDISPTSDINHVSSYEIVGEVIEETDQGPVNTATGEVVEPSPVGGEESYMPSADDDAWVAGKS
jgi:recombination protein RecT